MPNRQKTLRDRLFNDDTFTTVLLTIIVDTYGTEALSWAPQTLLMELEDDFNVRIPRLNVDKIVTGVNLLTSDDFFTRPPRFVQMCNVLAGSEMSRAFDKADAMECAWAMTEALLLVPPEDDEPFHEEIRYYLGRVVDEEGIKEPPDLLRLAIRSTPSGEADYSGMSLGDPMMFSVEHEIQADRSKEIKEMLNRELQDLFDQLEGLPLQNGNTTGLLKRIQGHLAA